MREFQELLKFPGWAQLVSYANGQVEAREAQMRMPAEGLDHLIQKEALNGEVTGINLFINIPAVVIEDYEVQLKELKEVLDNG